MDCPITKANCQTLQCNARKACAMQEGVGYSQLQQEPPAIIMEGASSTEEAQADSLEAHSLKYHHCCQLFLLSSGRYALFGSYQVASGIDLIAIGTWDEIRPHVDAYRALADQRAAEPRKVSMKPQTAKAALDYSSLFGDE